MSTSKQLARFERVGPPLTATPLVKAPPEDAGYEKVHVAIDDATAWPSSKCWL